MFTYSRIRAFVVLSVLLAVVFTTTPISAADFTKPQAVIGSVRGVGPVELRGAPISQQRTLSQGDLISVGTRGYAKVSLVGGRKLELDSMTKLAVVRNGRTAQLQVISGNMGFVTMSGTLNIAAGNYEITGDRKVVGNVAYVGNDFLGLRVMGGTATVRNLTTNETVRVKAGQERLFSMQSADSKTPVAQLASLGLPDPIPAAPRAPRQAANSGAGSNEKVSRTGWIAIAATVVGVVTALLVLANPGNHTPVK